MESLLVCVWFLDEVTRKVQIKLQLRRTFFFLKHELI